VSLSKTYPTLTNDKSCHLLDLNQSTFCLCCAAKVKMDDSNKQHAPTKIPLPYKIVSVVIESNEDCSTA